MCFRLVDATLQTTRTEGFDIALTRKSSSLFRQYNHLASRTRPRCGPADCQALFSCCNGKLTLVPSDKTLSLTSQPVCHDLGNKKHATAVFISSSRLHSIVDCKTRTSSRIFIKAVLPHFDE